MRDNFFRVSGPLDFNDPFECRGCYHHFDEVLRKYVHQNFERLRFESIRRTNSTTPELQARFTEEFLFETYFDSASRSLDSSWINAVNKTVLMLCFVKERGLKAASDVLFWSHYADSGKGVRIVFDLPETLETEKIDLVIELEQWNPEKIYDRMGVDTEYVTLLGVKIPSLTIPVKPGRNLAVILEVAAMNNRQKKMGYNAAAELLNRLGMQSDPKETVRNYENF